MSFTITNRTSGQQFAVEGDETILDAALRQGRVMPYSCRSGTCGTCKSTLVSGRVDYGTYESQAMTEEERNSGQVLICQARPLEDIVIEAREVAAAANITIKTLPCRVVQIEQLAHDVMCLYLKLPQGQDLTYLAGQYIDIILRNGKRRSFSLANCSRAEQDLQIHVRHVPDGQFTGHVFSNMKEKDLLRMQGPLGTFFLRAESECPVILMAGGTGFAPIKSILEQAFSDGIVRPIHLFWGARAARDLYLHELAEQWAQEHDNFTYTPVLSEPLDDENWDGEIGWVHDTVVTHYPDLSTYEVYASGPPPMIEAGKIAFAAHGLDSENLYYDSFEFAVDSTTTAS